MFPKWKYHRTRNPRLVKSQTEEDALGPSWVDSVIQFGIITCPSEDQDEYDPSLDTAPQDSSEPAVRRGRPPKIRE